MKKRIQRIYYSASQRIDGGKNETSIYGNA